jgi:hypothetical protein
VNWGLISFRADGNKSGREGFLEGWDEFVGNGSLNRRSPSAFLGEPTQRQGDEQRQQQWRVQAESNPAASGKGVLRLLVGAPTFTFRGRGRGR